MNMKDDAMRLGNAYTTDITPLVGYAVTPNLFCVSCHEEIRNEVWTKNSLGGDVARICMNKECPRYGLYSLIFEQQ